MMRMPTPGSRALVIPRMIQPPDAGTADSEAAVVARARGGDVRAFEILYRQCAGRVMAVCVRMTGDRVRAAELAHDAFVRAWQQIGSYRGDAAFSTWMHRLTVNVVLAESRSERRRAAHFDDGHETTEGADSALAGSVAPSDVLSRIDLERAISRLPPNARMVFVLHDLEGFRHDEIATQMELAPGTVRAHLHRARQLLMRMLTR
jgi:RNA polymerase sigma-70 factor, ECF subfamily